jgi:hypothetical protein
MSPLCYWFVKKGVLERVIFNKYTIENGVIKNAKGEPMAYNKNKEGYNRCSVYDDNGKRRIIRVARAIASTIYGPPPTLAHTADHKDKNRENDTDDNIRWATKVDQSINRTMSDTNKTAFGIIRYGEEKTFKEWTDYLNSRGEKNPYGREYTSDMIKYYAQKKQHGFSYKEYPVLPGEIWKEIKDSRNTQGYWEISNMNRVKYITNHAENVFSNVRLGINNGYPIIGINGRNWKCHILAFMTFFPEEYANKKPDEFVLHENDDRLDFRPHKLRLGTQSDNMIDAYNNGKHDGTKSERMKCVSYINGIYELMHDSQHDAEKYLRRIGYEKADRGNIGNALNPKSKLKSAYGRTWKRYDNM